MDEPDEAGASDGASQLISVLCARRDDRAIRGYATPAKHCERLRRTGASIEHVSGISNLIHGAGVSRVFSKAPLGFGRQPCYF